MMIKEPGIYECNNCGEIFELDEYFNPTVLNFDEWKIREEENMRITHDDTERNFDYKNRLKKYDDVDIVQSDKIYDDDTNFWKAIIPSRDVREYHKKSDINIRILHLLQ